MKKFARFDEIISKEQWESEYKKKAPINKEEYAKVKPYLIDMFTSLNGGEYADTVVFDYSSIQLEDTNEADRVLIDSLAKMGYEITVESYLAGQMTKDGKTINIMDFLGSFNSRINSYAKMQDTYKKTNNENIKKQLDAIDNFKTMGLIDDNKINLESLTIYDYKKGEQKIVFTMDIRAVASQSSFVGWKSCMRLNPDENSEQGMYANKVGPGISAGTFIAYLTRVGDEKELENPLGRVLLKPYVLFSEDGSVQKMTWFPSIYYPKENPNPNFEKKISIIMSRYAPKVEGFSRLTIHPEVYQDTYDNDKNITKKDKLVRTINREKINELSPDEQFIAVKKIPSLIKYIENPTKEMMIVAVNKDKKNIQYIKNPPEDMQLETVKNDGNLIQYIENPSTEVQLAAINSDSEAIKHIKNPSKEAVALATQLGEEIKESIIKRKYVKFFKEDDIMVSQDIQARPENVLEVAKVPFGDEEEEKKKEKKGKK